MKAIIPTDNNYEITDLEELKSFIRLVYATNYIGGDEETPAKVFPSGNEHLIIITYDDIWDCKRTEAELKRICTNLLPKKFDKKLESIGLSSSCKKALKRIKRGSESYEQIIWRLLLEHRGEL